MPVCVNTPLFEGEEVAQRLAEAMVATKFTKSRGWRALKRTSELLATYRLYCMRPPEHETFRRIPRRQRVVRKKQ